MTIFIYYLIHVMIITFIVIVIIGIGIVIAFEQIFDGLLTASVAFYLVKGIP